MDGHTLETTVTQFYEALATVAPTTGLFEDFPQEACDIASEMLAFHVAQRHNLEFWYCSGEAESIEPCRHDWLEHRGTVIDLTCGHFPDCKLECPYIGAKTIWHAQWDVEKYPLRDIDFDSAVISWGDVYHQVLAEIRRAR